ncbi:hypothetical protein EsVE80_07730 [Enterococcus saigonensis]|uniref:Transposase n=1 Tax=Enterococcus saigonensis TaxID=1805431 RepID=A0A679IA44_9ENTE|nr:hypothetical protein EsVE80_07730 [Enterococcus saigonensis]
MIATRKNKDHSKELKLEAFLIYLDGLDSQRNVVKKLQDWIKLYNSHEAFKSESDGSEHETNKKAAP